MNLEICCANILDVILANKFDIKRIELNQGLSVGGLTPSYSLFKKSIEISKVDIVCMLRAREGNFVYTDEEFEIMYEDAKFFLENGAKGIVFGFLDKNNEIDVEKTIKMVELTKKYGKEAIFHRAIDVSNNYLLNLKKLKDMGITRILTSGKEKNVDLGIENLKLALENNIPVIIGCGINAKNIEQYMKLGFNDIHGSFSKEIKNSYNIDFGDYKLCDYDKILEIMNLFK